MVSDINGRTHNRTSGSINDMPMQPNLRHGGCPKRKREK